jgi:hypothetical protein
VFEKYSVWIPYQQLLAGTEFETVTHVLVCSVRCDVVIQCDLAVVWIDVRVIHYNLSYFKYLQDILMSVLSETKSEHN